MYLHIYTTLNVWGKNNLSHNNYRSITPLMFIQLRIFCYEYIVQVYSKLIAIICTCIPTIG